jgi:sec-independent protein translocase protein TatA
MSQILLLILRRIGSLKFDLIALSRLSFPQTYEHLEAVMIPKLGTGELIIIAIVLILLFGVNKIPQLGKGLGEGIKNFKSSLKAGQEEDEEKDKEKEEKK